MRGGSAVWEMSSTCIQGGLPRPLGGYQPNLIMEPHSPVPAWIHHPVVPKQEPVEEEKNDSGVNSGSDFQSSSPGSEASQEYNPTSSYSFTPTSQNPQSYYSTPLISRLPPSPLGYQANIAQQLASYPVTATSNPICAQVPHKQADSEKKTPPPAEQAEGDDPLRRLQFALEKTGMVAPSSSSPKTSEHSMEDDNKSDFEGDEYDEQGLRVPRMNSHGKVKTYKCKQCGFVAITKLDFWEHTKKHIKIDKLLTCPKCPFVTEYKHHLEYHLRNHFGSKPFKCDKCSYSCVNKSMLNSHMKSHSNVYQYRCADCSYASKYCHSLKLHLRKYDHQPAMVLNPDGSPNPYPIVDVYGTRRGPKQKAAGRREEPPTHNPSILQNQLAQLMLTTSPHMQIPFPYHFLAGLQNTMPNPLLFPPAQSNPTEQKEGSSDRQQKSHPTAAAEDQQQPLEALDLSKPEPSPPEQQPSKNRRKGRAFKLEDLRANESSEDEEGASSAYSAGGEVMETEDRSSEVTNNNNNNNDTRVSYSCQDCSISFGDIVLYTMHMGYHGFGDPFTCNMCGEQCGDKVSFFLHIARNPHT